MEIRHPREGDILPLPLEFQTYDPQWVWIYGDSILIAVGGHDVVFLLRLVKWGAMPSLWAHRLLQHVKRECRERGFHRYMVWLASDLIEEQQLLKIAARDGARCEPFRGDVATGEI